MQAGVAMKDALKTNEFWHELKIYSIFYPYLFSHARIKKWFILKNVQKTLLLRENKIVLSTDKVAEADIWDYLSLHEVMIFSLIKCTRLVPKENLSLKLLKFTSEV